MTNNLKKFDIWVVAAAVLIRAGQTLHINYITRKVVESELTILPQKGRTPLQSVNSLINRNPDKFIQRGRGYKAIAGDHIAKHPDVARALRRWEEDDQKRLQKIENDLERERKIEKANGLFKKGQKCLDQAKQILLSL